MEVAFLSLPEVFSPAIAAPFRPGCRLSPPPTLMRLRQPWWMWKQCHIPLPLVWPPGVPALRKWQCSQHCWQLPSTLVRRPLQLWLGRRHHCHCQVLTACYQQPQLCRDAVAPAAWHALQPWLHRESVSIHLQSPVPHFWMQLFVHAPHGPTAQAAQPAVPTAVRNLSKKQQEAAATGATVVALAVSARVFCHLRSAAHCALLPCHRKNFLATL
mmetsp:Transcript_7057/g.13103  ORF Transcript_7057/g.13103 Transcript_7057/m.13103 type:complete len:214 (+) Transcript_7057:887-1528(+)